MDPRIIHRLDDRLWFPDPRLARRDGLVAVGGDLSVPRLLLAYRSGVFPWSAEPVTWWSPDPRGVFELTGFHISRSFSRSLRRGGFQVTVNRAFRKVIETCASAPRDSGTWISPEFIEAYTTMHREGHAHSVECWQGNALVGGVYGVAVGGLFAGESMFHAITDASKVALWHLVERLRERNFALLDTQMVTPATRPLGAVEISRDEYLDRLVAAVERPCRFA